jgi:hypothetical protein
LHSSTGKPDTLQNGSTDPRFLWRRLNTRVNFLIAFPVIVTCIVGFAVRDVEYQLVLKFADRKIRSIGTGNYLEAVIEQHLTFVVHDWSNFTEASGPPDTARAQGIPTVI